MRDAGPLPAGSRLNVGCGPCCPDGWVNIDGSWQAWLSRWRPLARLAGRLAGRPAGVWPRGILCRDIRRRLPFRDGSVAVVYSSHTIEHLFRDEALRFMIEARRVLQPGGICRIVVPDVAAIVRWYLAHREEPAAGKTMSDSDMLMELLGLQPRRPAGPSLLRLYRGLFGFETHKWMYDAGGLLALLREAGFAEPRVRGYLESAIPPQDLAQVERRDRLADGAGVCAEAGRC